MSAPDIPAVFAAFLLATNALSILVSMIDKRAALNGRRLVPEPFLCSLALFGGAPGAKLAQAFSEHEAFGPDFKTLSKPRRPAWGVLDLAVTMRSPGPVALALTEIRETSFAAQTVGPVAELALPGQFGSRIGRMDDGAQKLQSAGID